MLSSAGPSPSLELLFLMNHPFLIEKPNRSQTLMLWERTTGQAAFPTDPWRSALQHHYQRVTEHDVLGSTLFWGAPKLYRAVHPAMQRWPYRWELQHFDIRADATVCPPTPSSAAGPSPCNQPMPQTSFTDTTCVGEQAQCFPTSTNIHRQQTTIVWRLLQDRPHRTAACIQGRIPVLQPTHQCPCPHNANHNPTICHALAEQFKPC